MNGLRKWGEWCESMGKMMRRIEFSIIVNDYEKWTDQHLRECENSNIGFDDFATEKVRAAMEQAGRLVIENNPDLFTGDLV